MCRKFTNLNNSFQNILMDYFVTRYVTYVAIIEL